MKKKGGELTGSPPPTTAGRGSKKTPPPLPPECPDTLSEAVETVLAEWEAHGVFAPLSLVKYSTTLRRFTMFAAAHQVTSLPKVDAALAGAFIVALGRNRRGQVVTAATPRAQLARRAALRGFYSAVVIAGWVGSDPTSELFAEEATPSARTPRPLTDSEAAHVRFHAGSNPAHLTPAATALLLSGVWAGEAHRLLPEAFDPQTRGLDIPGVHGRRARAITLGEDAARIIAARLDWLLTKHSAVSLLFGDTHRPERQANIANTTRVVLDRAGLGHDPEVTPASLTLHAALSVFEQTGRIEDAAMLIGYRSLDQAARDLRWGWDAEGNGC